MSEIKKESKSVETQKNIAFNESAEINEQELKINNKLKERLRKYIKKFVGKYLSSAL